MTKKSLITRIHYFTIGPADPTGEAGEGFSYEFKVNKPRVPTEEVNTFKSVLLTLFRIEINAEL